MVAICAYSTSSSTVKTALLSHIRPCTAAAVTALCGISLKAILGSSKLRRCTLRAMHQQLQ
eukprot:11937-Heterococcus_DN1.PRE.2